MESKEIYGIDKSVIDEHICQNCKFYKSGQCLNQCISYNADGSGLKYEKVAYNDNCANFQSIKLPEPTEEEAKEMLKKAYDLIIKILRKYCDLKEENYHLIALWIIGTHFHKKFPTYPYLFLNAMKGSGKTRLMKLILALSKDGRLCNHISEAVLFRTASMRTFGIDEFENVGGKEKNVLRELLNSAYKQGTYVERAFKRYTDEGDRIEIESYNLYCPLVIANIAGMEEVLGDRCIKLIIDKSGNNYITRLLELFDTDKDILEAKRLFSVVSVVKLCHFDVVEEWNSYLYTYYTNNTNNTIYTNYTNPFLEKIYRSNLDSRNLELFFPILIIAQLIGENVVDLILSEAEEFIKSKKDDDIYESRDVTFLNFIANSKNLFESLSDKGFIRLRDIVDKYRQWIEWDERSEEWKWLNDKWIGRALKRLNLILEKKRIAKGMEVILDFDKAIEKAGMFKKEEKIAI